MPHPATKRPLGILFVGHGTRNKQGQVQFLDLAHAIRDKLQPIPLEPAFLELAEPSIDDAVQALASQAERILTVPLLLFSAGHAKEDIPDAVQAACQQHSIQNVGQTEPLQHAPALLQLASLRFREALTPQDQSIPTQDRALLMLGRGSSDLTATRAMRHLTLLRKQADCVAYAGTSFFAVAKPDPATLFDYIFQRRQEKLIVVQPHLLFDGLLWQQALNMVQEYQAKSPHRQWRITQPLGADIALAQAISEIIVNHMQQKLSE
jgi:sirohydrochlorin cobaltochelatase